MAIPALQAFIGSVGPGTYQDGGTPAVRLGRSGEIVVDELHGRYYESVYRGNVYSGGNVGGVVTTVGVATTYTGLCLSNPPGSGANLVVLKVGLAFIVAWPAASLVGIMTGFSGTAVTQTTPITPARNLVGGGAGIGLLASSVTLPVAPTVRQMLLGGLTGAITVQTAAPAMFDLEGSIVLPPGGFAAVFTSTISGAAGMGASFTWEEVAI